MDMVNLYQYTNVPREPLALDDIVNGTFMADWPPYTDFNKDFMYSMMLAPSKNSTDIKAQFVRVEETLRSHLIR